MSRHYHNITDIVIENFYEFTPKIHGLVLALFLLLSILVVFMCYIVNKSVYATLKKFESRPINDLIMPCSILSNYAILPYCVILVAKAVYYPLKNVTGTEFCHIHNYYDVWSMAVGQSHSFYITLFRFICLFHTNKLQRWGITAKVRYFYIVSETPMLRNHYFSGFFSKTKVWHSSPKVADCRMWQFLSQSVFNHFIEFSHLGVNNSWLI